MRIVLDRSNQPYCPGSSVTGHVLVEVNKPKSFKRISIQFLGRARVHWTERRDGGGRPGSGVCTAEYPSSEIYVDLEQTLWTAEQSTDRRLPRGQHNFPFRFDIPPNAPSSFEGTVGSILYTLHGRIATGPLKMDQRIKVTVPVQQMVRISDQRLLQPVRQVVQKTVCRLCCASAPVVLTVTLPKTGYYTRETLPVHVSIENKSSFRITLNASLHQSVMYAARGRHRFSKMCLVSEQNKIAPHITSEWNPSLQISANDVTVLDERSCSNIKISYSLKITASIFLGSNFSTEIPLQLGYVSEQPPLEWNILPPQPTPQDQPPPYPHDKPPPYSQTAPALYQAAPIGQTP